MEDLVVENYSCLKYVTEKLKNASKKTSHETNRSNKTDECWRNKSPNAVAKVYSSIEEPQINYSDVPLGNTDEEHSFVRKIDDKIFVAWPNRNARHGNTH